MRIDFLADQRHVAQLASWHHAEWERLYSDWTLEAATAELEDHARRRTIPTTLCLLDDEHLLGSVSVVLEDAPELQGEGDVWLASLYVIPGARGHGHGARLVRAAVAMATEQGVTRLNLFTADQVGFYERLGWSLRGHTMLRGTRVNLMDCALPVAHAA